MIKTKLALSGVFCVAFAILSFNLWKINIASGWIDPLLDQGAQDEAAYTREAIDMARTGDWLTPALAGRFVLEKPPLLIWLSALSMKLLGIGPLAARLPAVLSGALIASLCFAIGRLARSAGAGITAALLCVSNALLFTLSRHNMTDILLAAAVLATFAALAFDPQLQRRAPRIAFVLAIAAAILSKSIAGLLPAIAALLFAMLCRGPRWNQVRRTAFLIGAALTSACPWFIYQLLVHRQWFLSDLSFQIVTVGIHASAAPMGNPVWFYLVRCLNAAPLAVLLAFAAVPALVRGVRHRETLPLLLCCFGGVIGVALLGFRFLSATYLAPLLPLVALVAVLPSRRSLTRVLPYVAITAFAIKASNPDQDWGLSYRPGSTVDAVPALVSYCNERRGNDLYILGVDDQFYALVLPLARVHYGWLDPSGAVVSSRPHLAYLGIVQDITSPLRAGIYATRLRAWGQKSTQAVGAGLTARTIDELVTLVTAHPESDFLVTPEIARRLAGRDPHEPYIATTAYVLLQSRIASRGSPGWSCNI